MVLCCAGDLMKSMQVLVYKAEDGVLEVCARVLLPCRRIAEP